MEPFHWELDETGQKVIEKIIEDEVQGPSKEWGPYGWYRHYITSDIYKAGMGNAVFLSPTIPI